MEYCRAYTYLCRTYVRTAPVYVCIRTAVRTRVRTSGDGLLHSAAQLDAVDVPGCTPVVAPPVSVLLCIIEECVLVSTADCVPCTLLLGLSLLHRRGCVGDVIEHRWSRAPRGRVLICGVRFLLCVCRCRVRGDVDKFIAHQLTSAA